MIRVNLLAEGPLRARTWRGAARERRMTFVALSVLLFTILGMSSWQARLRATAIDLQRESAARQQQLLPLERSAALVARLTTRKAELQDRLALIEQVRRSQRLPVVLLDAVSESIADGLWLLELKRSGPTVTFDGRATSLDALIDFAARLHYSGCFDRPVEILSALAETVEDSVVVRFAIKAEAGI